MGKIEVEGIEAEVVRKAIKHLHLRVYPPDGRVGISAPLKISEKRIRLALQERIGWVREERAKIAASVRPDGFYFLGRPYPINLVEAAAFSGKVVEREGIIDLFLPAESPEGMREKLLEEWHRGKLKEMLPALFDKWEAKIGVKASGWGIKKMRSRWGSCNTVTGKIWINLELIKTPPSCLEYIVAHELVHLLEASHNRRFWDLMTRFMSDWREQRALLNSFYIKAC